MHWGLAKITSLLERALTSTAVGAIKIWQATRFLRPQSCRFYPTCSEYMLGCIKEHGAFAGISLGLMRIAKCHPLNCGGIDEVPRAASHAPPPNPSRP